MGESAQEESTNHASKAFKTLVGIILLLFIIFIGLLGYYFYVYKTSPLFQKVETSKIKIETPKVTPNQYQNPFETTAGAEYQNPFREKESGYQNPFREVDENVQEQKEYENPFRNLGK